MPTADVLSGEITITQCLIDAAAARRRQPALATYPAGSAYSYAELSDVIQAAAAGLAWRGLQCWDVVGVQVPDAACHALAVHAIRAAGGLPSPIGPGLTVPEIAGQLADCGARMLLTAPPLVRAALAAADRSWVRQVISFGDCAGTMSFASLLSKGTRCPPAGRPQDVALLSYVRGPRGNLGPAPLTHHELAAAVRSLDAETSLGEHDIVLAGPPAGDGRRYTAQLDHALLRGTTVVAAGFGALAEAAGDWHPTAAIVPAGTPTGLPPSVRLLLC